VPCCDDRRSHRDELRATDLAKHLERIEHAGDPVHRLANGLALAREPLVVDTGSPTHPCCDLAAAERCGDGRGSCRVADAHLAEDEEVGVERLDGIPACGRRLREALRGHRRHEADVTGRVTDADVDRLDRRAGHGCEGADGRLPCAVCREHRRRHVGGGTC
jgi:hypothetical protein